LLGSHAHIAIVAQSELRNICIFFIVIALSKRAREAYSSHVVE
jgi:hypothetical protein